MKLTSFRQLIVWQKGIELATKIYKTTEQFPKSEIFGIRNQMRRASVSVPSNIAEGRERGTRKDFVQFLRISLGSIAELETQIEISKNVGFIVKNDYENIIDTIVEIRKMLYKMIDKLMF